MTLAARSFLVSHLLVLFALVMPVTPQAAAAEQSVAELSRAAQSGAEAARIAAIDELAARGEAAAEAVEPLAKLLKADSAAVRAHAARALGQIGKPSSPAVAPLAALIKDEDPQVRRQAVKALAAIHPGPKVMVPMMVKMLEDADPGVRVRILNSVAEAGPAAVPALIEALKNDKADYWACLVLREMGPAAKAAVPALAEKLQDKRPEIRREAALTLGAMQEAAAPAVPQLVGALDDAHAQVAVIFALGQIGQIPAEAEAKIKKLSQSENKFVSTVSFWTLARVHPDDKELRREATERLVERIMDEDAYVRVAAARALTSLPPAPEISLPIWEKALKNADATTMQHALDALASLGSAAVPRLIDALKHDKLRAQIIYILGQIGAAAAPATDTLAKLVTDEDSEVATEAALALAKIGPGAASSVPALTAALAKKDSPNAHAIVFALGKLKGSDAEVAPKLVELLKSDDRSLAIMSAWALAQRNPSANAAKVLPVLTAGLNEPLAESRHTAADGLGALGSAAKSALSALKKATQDKDPAVRAAAAAALGKVDGSAK